jgi:hypothetical protein
LSTQTATIGDDRQTHSDSGGLHVGWRSNPPSGTPRGSRAVGATARQDAQHDDRGWLVGLSETDAPVTHAQAPLGRLDAGRAHRIALSCLGVAGDGGEHTGAHLGVEVAKIALGAPL